MEGECEIQMVLRYDTIRKLTSHEMPLFFRKPRKNFFLWQNDPQVSLSVRGFLEIDDDDDSSDLSYINVRPPVALFASLLLGPDSTVCATAGLV